VTGTPAIHPPATLYFGYGSNLNDADMRRWADERNVPHLDIQPLEPVWLPDYVPIFDYYSRSRQGGAINLRPRRGGLTPGVLFRAADQDWRSMDRKEGAGGGFYRRLPIWALDHRGNRIAAETYEACPDRRGAYCKPSEGYLRIVQEGLARFGLPQEGLSAAAQDRSVPYTVRHLFVYGTLRSGGTRHGLLSEEERASLQPAEIDGHLLNLGAYPGFLPGPGTVHGELISLEDVSSQLGQLDSVEGFNGYGSPLSLFHRVLVTARVPTGDPVLAWTYAVVNPPLAALLITSGDWLKAD